MIVSTFKRNLFINTVLLLPFAIIVRLYSLVFPQNIPTSQHSGVLYNMLMNILPNEKLLYNILSIILIYIGATQINRISVKNRLGKELTLMPGYFYIILSSFSPDMLGLSPAIIGSMFIILAFVFLFKSYKKYNSQRYLFDIGLLLSLATLFDNNLVFFIIPFIVGYLSIRQFKIRELFQLLSGFLVVIYFYAVYIYLSETNFDFKLTLDPLNLHDNPTKIIYGIYVFIFLIIALKYRSFTLKKSIQSQNKINILFWFMLFSIISVMFFFSTNQSEYFLLIPICMCFFISELFLTIKNNLLLEIINIVILFMILIYHFQFF